ncbi:hypothetical protein MMC07_003009 [Pseudocyphellaria aurata]|nr:hypothetical protein [Pseudocyphellaria aurata]
MNTEPFRLTFGVELEFLVRLEPEKCGDEVPEEFVCHRITQILNEGGFSTQSYAYTTVQWSVTHDGTISNEGCINNHAIELKSPALVYSPSALQQVSDVVKLLNSNLDLFVNKSCGFHVHVGNETRGFSLRTLKTFGSLITAFENQLNLFHPLDRHQNGFAKPLYTAFPKSAPPREKMEIIDDLETVDELIRQFHPVYDKFSEEDVFELSRNHGCNDRYMAFNFFNLHGDLPRNTIEFRQHSGTLDADQIVNWVRVVCTLVQTSYADREGVRGLIAQELDNADYTTMQLLVDLQLPDLAGFYAQIVARHESELSAQNAFENKTSEMHGWLDGL